MSFTTLLADSAQLYKYSSSSEYGKVTYAAVGSAFACRFDPQEGRRVVNQVGDEEIIDGTVFFAGSVAVDVKDQILISSVRYRIVNAKKQKGFGSAHHWELSVRKV